MARSRARLGARMIAGAAVFSLVLSGCGKVDNGSPPPQGSQQDNRAVKAGGTMRVALDGEPDKLDPTLARTLVGRNVFNAICEKLYDINDKLEVVPQLAAAAPEISSDGLTVKIKLRTGLKF